MTEAQLAEYYTTRLSRVQRDIDQYNVRKPFARAKDSKDQQLRLNEARMCRDMLKALSQPAEARDPVAAYDINSFCHRTDRA